LKLFVSHAADHAATNVGGRQSPPTGFLQASDYMKYQQNLSQLKVSFFNTNIAYIIKSKI